MVHMRSLFDRDAFAISRDSEAEEAIVRVWLTLEAYHIATPRPSVTHDGPISVALLFASPHDADRVLEHLQQAGLAASPQRVH